MPHIVLEGVGKAYGAGPPAVEGLDLTVPDGAFMCLLGPSGCGKTTTLRMIAGLEHPTAGRVAIGSRVVSSVADGLFVPAEKRGIGLVFQSYALWPHLTVARNVDFGLRLRRMPRAEREARVHTVLDRMGIAALKDRYPSQLSGGQQQRVALARMLAVNPGVLLLDEPLSNLDARLRLEMRTELKRIHTEFATTIVFVTHDQWEAMTLATEIALMADGALQQVGTPDEIHARPRNRFVAEFVGNPPINIVECGPDNALAGALVRFVDQRSPGLGPAVACFGLRPEAIAQGPGPAGGFTAPARITGVLPTGGSWILELACLGARLFQIVHEPPVAGPGTEIEIRVPAGALHLFDAAGERLAAADAALRGGTHPRDVARAAG